MIAGVSTQHHIQTFMGTRHWQDHPAIRLALVPQAEPRAGYADSIESLVRNNIQKMKIDMANEVIDAGRFDMNTTMDERRHTLEEMLQASHHCIILSLPMLALYAPLFDPRPLSPCHSVRAVIFLDAFKMRSCCVAATCRQWRKILPCSCFAFGTPPCYVVLCIQSWW